MKQTPVLIKTSLQSFQETIDVSNAYWKIDIDCHECVKREEWKSPFVMHLQTSLQAETIVFRMYVFIELILTRGLQVTTTLVDIIKLVIRSQIHLLKAIYNKDLVEKSKVVYVEPGQPTSSCGPASIAPPDPGSSSQVVACKPSSLEEVGYETRKPIDDNDSNLDDAEPLVALLELDTVLEEVRKVERTYLNDQINKIVAEQTRNLWDRIVEVAKLATKNDSKLTDQVTNLGIRLKNCHKVFQEGHQLAQDRLGAIEEKMEARFPQTSGPSLTSTGTMTYLDDIVQFHAPDFDPTIDEEEWPMDIYEMERRDRAAQLGSRPCRSHETIPAPTLPSASGLRQPNSCPCCEYRHPARSTPPPVPPANQQPAPIDGAKADQPPSSKDSPLPRHTRTPASRRRRRERYRAARAATLKTTTIQVNSPTAKEDGENKQPTTTDGGNVLHRTSTAGHTKEK